MKHCMLFLTILFCGYGFEMQSKRIVDVSANGKCAVGWLRYGSYCYLFYTAAETLQGKNWEDSLSSCQAYGGNLLSVTDLAENSFITNQLNVNNIQGKQYWIGLNDILTEGKYVWSDDTTSGYFNWKVSEPNNRNNEDCIETSLNGWNDNCCDNLLGFICKVRSDPKWTLIKRNACFQGKDDLPANVPINQNGLLVATKLIYLNGRMKCHDSFVGSNFGCFNDQTKFNLAICDNNRVVLFPPPNQELTYDGAKNYMLPGFLPTDKEVIFTNYDYPTYMKTGDFITIWNYEDLLNNSDGDNSGKVCVDVYGAFINIF